MWFLNPDARMRGLTDRYCLLVNWRACFVWDFQDAHATHYLLMVIHATITASAATTATAAWLRKCREGKERWYSHSMRDTAPFHGEKFFYTSIYVYINVTMRVYAHHSSHPPPSPHLDAQPQLPHHPATRTRTRDRKKTRVLATLPQPAQKRGH